MKVKQQNKSVLTALAVYVAILTAILLLSNVDAFSTWISGILLVFRPVLIGLVLAYLANPFFRFFEKKVFYKLRFMGLRRVLALSCTYLTLLMILVVLVLLIVPQLASNIQNFVNNRDTYFQSTVTEINGLIDFLNDTLPAKADGSLPIQPLELDALSHAFDKLINSIHFDFDRFILEDITSEGLSEFWDAAMGVIKMLADIVIGIFVSIYLLFTKEKRYAQIMRLRRAIFSDNVNATITRICTTADKSFGGFLKGKLLDSMLVGILVYITISIFGVPYAILIATIVAITDIVPVIGPFIGVIPSALLIFLIDPPKVIIFLICILVIQQIDGNILAPKILGENTGVSSLCVLIAIAIMGAVWGFVGMVLGVPLFATILELTNNVLEKRLRQKGLPTDTEIYQSTEMITATTSAAKDASRRRRRANKQRTVVLRSGEGEISAFERFTLETLALTKKHRLFNDSFETALERFAQEETALMTSVNEEIAAESLPEKSYNQMSEDSEAVTKILVEEVNAAEESSTDH